MFQSMLPAVALLCCLVSPSVDDLRRFGPDEARKLARQLCEAAKFDKPQVKIECDVEKADGLHTPNKAGLLIVPQKDLKEGEELAAQLKSDKGAPLALLFLYRIRPVIDNKLVDPSRLRSVQITDGGNEHKVHVLLLAVRQFAEDDYRLHAYGEEAKPLFEAKFAEGTGPGAEPVAIEVKDIDEQTARGNIVITVFGKYQATFRAGHGD